MTGPYSAAYNDYRPYRWSLLLLAIIMMLAFSTGCSEEGSVSPDAGFNPGSYDDYLPYIPDSTQVDTLLIPDTWVLGNNDFRKIAVELSLAPELQEAIRNGGVSKPGLFVVVQRLPVESFGLTFLMHDDGGAIVHEDVPDNPPFVATRTGDLIPGDFIYSAQINSLFANSDSLSETADYRFSFYFSFPTMDAPNGNDENALFLTRTVSVTESQPPVVEQVTMPDSLYAGFGQQQWTATVTDPDSASGDQVEAVEVALLNSDDDVAREFLFEPLNQPLWGYNADSAFAAGLATGDYILRFIARDQYELESEPFETAVWIENIAPVLTNPTAPDTVYQPGPDDPPNAYTFTVDVRDSQGQGDIEQVYYTVIDPTGNFAQSPDFVFRDDGEGNDEVAGDGIWTHTFIVTSDVSNFGEYTFTFYADDRAGNTSEPISEPIYLQAFSGSNQ